MRLLVPMAAATIVAGCIAPPAERPEPQPLPEPTLEKARVRPGAAEQPELRGLPPGGSGNPPFYDVAGERYFVLPDSNGYVEQGVASWYGREFHGRRTSSGEVYDMYAMTAAHKTLPLPTTARVTSLTTGKSIVVRINDRGPFKKGRIIDLSYGAARELGFLNAGTALVEVETMSAGGASGPAAGAAPVTRSMFVQVGAFGERRNAEELLQKLRREGFPNAVIRYDSRAETALYRVRIGPIASARDYDEVAARVSRLRLGEPRLVVEAAPAGPPAAETGGAPGG